MQGFHVNGHDCQPFRMSTYCCAKHGASPSDKAWCLSPPPNDRRKVT